MKSLVLALLILVAAGVLSPASAQIPNPGFETWIGTTPSGWTTDNIPSVASPVTASSSAHSGSAAIQGAVMNVVGLVYPPVITAEFPVTQRYSSFSGWYKMTAVGGDSLRISVLMAVGNTEMGYTIANLPGTGSSYVQFSMNLAYLLPGNPDTCFISALITGPASASDSPHVGSTFWLDDLSLSGTATAVAQQPGAPRTFALDQNFPNPFNPTTQISYELAAAGPVRLTVYDVLGRKVASLVDGEEQAGSHQVRFDGTGLASGVYIYRLQTPSALLQKKMMLVK